MKAIRAVPIAHVAFLAAFGLTLFGLAVPSFRHFAYLTPLLSVVVMLANGRIYVPLAVQPFLLLVLLVPLYGPWMEHVALKDWFFIFSGISIGLAVGRISLKLHWLLALFIAVWLLRMAVSGRLAGGGEFNLLQSRSSVESGIAFLFAMLGVVFIAQRRWRMLGLVVVLAIFSAKRIALLGLLVCLLVSLSPIKWRRVLLNPYVLILANLGVLALMFVYTQGFFDNWIRTTFDQSANQLGMGRQRLFSGAVYEMLRNPWGFIFWGAGPEAGYQMLPGDGRVWNLHSDVLKIAFEYGVVVLVLFLWLLHRRGNDAQRLLALYVNVLLITDNTLIYHYFLMTYVLLSMWLDTQPPRCIDFVAGKRPEPIWLDERAPDRSRRASG